MTHLATLHDGADAAWWLLALYGAVLLDALALVLLALVRGGHPARRRP